MQQKHQQEELARRQALMERYLRLVPKRYQFEGYPSNSWWGGTFVSLRRVPLLKKRYELPPVLRSPADVKGRGLKKPACEVFEGLLCQPKAIGSVELTDPCTFTVNPPMCVRRMTPMDMRKAGIDSIDMVLRQVIADLSGISDPKVVRFFDRLSLGLLA